VVGEGIFRDARKEVQEQSWNTPQADLLEEINFLTEFWQHR
jgi:hypothetical protein